MTQTTLKPYGIKSNKNISFPVGTALAVQKYSDKLDFKDIFSRFKKRGADITKLIEALLSYKLTENQSISRASDWINRPAVLDQFSLQAFEERTLFRVLEILGENYEEIIQLVQDQIF